MLQAHFTIKSITWTHYWKNENLEHPTFRMRRKTQEGRNEHRNCNQAKSMHQITYHVTMLLEKILENPLPFHPFFSNPILKIQNFLHPIPEWNKMNRNYNQVKSLSPVTWDNSRKPISHSDPILKKKIFKTPHFKISKKKRRKWLEPSSLPASNYTSCHHVIWDNCRNPILHSTLFLTPHIRKN